MTAVKYFRFTPCGENLFSADQALAVRSQVEMWLRERWNETGMSCTPVPQEENVSG